MRFIVSGGAPLATHIEEYLACALGAPVFQASVQLTKQLSEHEAGAVPCTGSLCQPTD